MALACGMIWQTRRMDESGRLEGGVAKAYAPRQDQPMTTAPDVPAETNPKAALALRIIESVPPFAWSADPSGRLTYVSPNALAYLGAPQEDLNPSRDGDEFGWRHVVHPDDYERVAGRWRHCVQTGDYYDAEQRLRRTDGVYRWFRTFGGPSRDSHGRITEWYGSTIDIHDQKQAEAALRARERELSQLVDMVPSHLWRLAPDGEPIFFNKRMVDFLGRGLTDTDKPGMSRLAVFMQTNIHPDDAAAFREILINCLTTGESFSCRYRLRRADGVYRWMSGRAEPIRDEGGRITQWYGLAHDVDDQVRAEEALRQSEQQLRQMIYAVPVRIWSIPAAGGPIAFNKRFQDHLRSVFPNFEDLADPSIERVMQELIHSEDAPEVWRTLQACFEAGAAAAMRFRWRERDGIYRWAECRVEPRRNQDGEIEEWYGISLDIDDEMRAQEALRARERELELLVDMVPVNIGRVSADGLPTFFNKRLIDFLGVDIADLDKPGMSRLAAAIATAIHPDDAPGFTEAFGDSLATGEPLFRKYRLHRADGVYRWVENRIEPLRDQDGVIVQWYGVSLDIDDEVRAQQALQRSERQLQQLIDTVPAVIWCATPEGIPCYLNRRATEVIGLTLTDLLAPDGSRSLTVVHPDDRETFDQALARSFKTGTSFEGRYRQRRADGTHRWVESRAEPLRDDSGNIVQWYGVTVDVHDMVTTQGALLDRERELSQLVNMVPIFLWRLMPDGTCTFFNKRLSDFFGRDVADYERPGMSQLEVAIDEVVHPDEKVGFGEEFNRCFTAGERFAMRYRARRFDGVYRWVDGQIVPMRGQDGHILQWYGLAYDIDDQVHAEEALRRAADKLARATQAASLAELSASIAHEVNQPLAAIVANSHACQRWLESDPPNLERAQIIMNRIIRDARSAAEVVSRIRALFRQTVEPRNPTALASIIAEARNLVTEEATRRRVRIEEEIESDLPLVAFDRVQIQQVLINLIGNGMDAMDFSAGHKVLKVRVRRMEDTVQTEISDRGQGIAFPDKIFEPFFTTKENGMGMGLAICRSIVESHGGRLWAENNRPHGATFIFTLPVEEKAAS